MLENFSILKYLKNKKSDIKISDFFRTKIFDIKISKK